MEPSAKDFVNLVQSERARLVVGQGTEKETFYLPKDLLARKSKHFATGFSDKWGEPSAGIALPELTVPAFKIFTYWLYKNDLPDTHHPDKISRSLLREWIDTWLLFDYLTMPKQQNLAMRKLCDIAWHNAKHSNVMTVDDVAYMLGKGHAQLRFFAGEALVFNIGRGGAEWTAFEGLHQDTGFVAELWSKHLRPGIMANVLGGHVSTAIGDRARGKVTLLDKVEVKEA